MISRPLSRPVSRSTQLLFGTLLGLMTLGAAAQAASANPLQTLPIIGDLLGATRQPAPLPSNLGLLNDNVRNNSLNLCVLTCNTPTLGTPSGLGAPVSSQIPSGGQQPVPSQIPPGTRLPGSQPGSQAGAPSPSGRPHATLNVPPIQLPF